MNRYEVYTLIRWYPLSLLDDSPDISKHQDPTAMLTASGEHAKSLKKWKAQQCWSQICCPANTLGNQHVLFKIYHVGNPWVKRSEAQTTVVSNSMSRTHLFDLARRAKMPRGDWRIGLVKLALLKPCCQLHGCFSKKASVTMATLLSFALEEGRWTQAIRCLPMTFKEFASCQRSQAFVLKARYDGKACLGGATAASPLSCLGPPSKMNL